MMKKKELTEIQKQIFEILKDYISKYSIPPTIKELGAMCGLSSSSSVHHQLLCLEEKGYIVRDKTKSRSIRIVKGKRGRSSAKTESSLYPEKSQEMLPDISSIEVPEISADMDVQTEGDYEFDPSLEQEPEILFDDDEADLRTERETRIEAGIRSEMEDRVRAEIRAEMEARMGAEIRSEMEDRIRAEIRAEMEARMGAEIRSEMEGRLRAEIRAEEEARFKVVEKGWREALEEKVRYRTEEEARFRAVEEGWREALEEKARLKAEEEARIKAEEEARLRAEEEARIKAEEEARLRAEEEARLKAEEEARIKAEEEARLRAEEEARIKAEEEARIKAEEEARLKAEEEARLKAEEEARLKAEEEARLKAEEEARLKAEEEARIKAEEEARLKAEEEARLRAKEEARLKAEEEARLRAEEEARLKAEEEARIKAEEEARLKAEEEARIKAEEEARLKAEEEARIKAEEEARLKAEEEARLKAEEEARLRAEEEARLKAEEEARIKAEEEARLRAEEEARLKAEEEAHLKAEEEARIKAEEEARIKAEEEARLKAEEEPPMSSNEVSYQFIAFDDNLSPFVKDTYTMSSDLFGVSDACIVEANEDLEDFGIYKGELVLVEYNDVPVEGDMVFAIANGRLVLRSVSHVGDGIVLSDGDGNESGVGFEDYVQMGVIRAVFKTSYSKGPDGNFEYSLISFDSGSYRVDGAYSLPKRLMGCDDAFLYLVSDDDMDDFGISKGDIAIIESNDDPSFRNVVLVASYDGRVILRLLENGDDSYVSLKAGDDEKSVSALRGHIGFIGVMKGIIRKIG